SDRIFEQEFELYDLASDPQELTNLADDPEYASVLAQLWWELARLQERYQDLPYQGPDTPRPDWSSVMSDGGVRPTYPASAQAVVAQVQPAHLPCQLLIGAGNGHVRGHRGDRQPPHRRFGQVPPGEPLGELRRAGGVHDTAHPGPGVRGGAHRAVLTGGVDGGARPHAGAQVLDRPSHQRQLRMSGGITGGDPVAIPVHHRAAGIDQYRAERFVAGLESLARQVHALAQVLAVLVGHSRGIHTADDRQHG